MEVTIRVEEMKVWAYLGVYSNEKKQGAYFVIDVEIKIEVSREEILKDELSATYNYENIASIVHDQMQLPCSLLEKKAIEIATAIQGSDKRIRTVQIKLKKLNPPLMGEVSATSVEILV